MEGPTKPGFDVLAAVARAAGAHAVVVLCPAMSGANKSGQNPYRDEVHPSAAGQRVIGEVLTDAVSAAVERLGPPDPAEIASA